MGKNKNVSMNKKDKAAHEEEKGKEECQAARFYEIGRVQKHGSFGEVKRMSELRKTTQCNIFRGAPARLF